MEELTLTTPALLFSAISLIMLAYTNRFLAYAAVIRNLHGIYLERKEESLIRQIKNLKLRLNLTRWMQIFGISSLLFCVLTSVNIGRDTSYTKMRPCLLKSCNHKPFACIGTTLCNKSSPTPRRSYQIPRLFVVCLNRPIF